MWITDEGPSGKHVYDSDHSLIIDKLDKIYIKDFKLWCKNKYIRK